jgi:hypothetical protein
VLEGLEQRRSASCKSSLKARYFIGRKTLELPEPKELGTICINWRPSYGSREITE